MWWHIWSFSPKATLLLKYPYTGSPLICYSLWLINLAWTSPACSCTLLLISTGHPDQLVCHNMGWTSRWMGTRYRLVTWAGDHICCFVSVVLLELNLMVPCIEHFINGQMLTWCYKTFCLFIEESCDDSCSSKTIILRILPSLPIIIKWYNRR